MLEQLDRDLFLLLNGLHAPWLDVPMWYISWTATWIPLFVFICWYAWKKFNIKFMLLLLVAAGISVAITDRVSVVVFKNQVERYRPTHNLEIKDKVHTVITPEGKEYRGGLYGFVSSHAANFSGITLLMVLWFRKKSRWWYLLFLWLFLIAYSRIYLGVHYPADLLVGGLVGLASGLLVFSLQQWLLKKYKIYPEQQSV
ncbi:MAG: phosphatase PAP2 family protein [Crocinitomicaceae bacterium]|nr:phosphatase PAP2 family protein [Crocinitomicaceae bacterium]